MEWGNVVAGQRADPEQINKIGNQVAKYKGLRLARRVVLTEAVSVIEFNADSDGNSLNSAMGGELSFYSGDNASVGTQAVAYIQLNGVTTNSYWTSSTNPSSSINVAWVGSSFSEFLVNIRIMQQNIAINSMYSQKNTSSGAQGVMGGGMFTPQSNVNRIKLFLSSGTFPAGTVVEWWERG
ncbi:MAG: hypothetical protein VB047_06770 [Anaerotignum propionicum]|uniref:hypothetical protein n=1 Tax=Anaerotignum propionicum TaxID=28446 RepID=UPI002B1F1FDF|nr:hypothetical protein [Anaerotignum propionicum]MEA5057244.1 hypothetical protein [Anaerotignum propionicum]